MSDATASLTLNNLTADQVVAIMAVINGDAPAPAKAPTKAASKPKPSTKAATKPKEEKPVESDEGGTPTADDVRNALKAYRGEHSKEDAEKIIAATGAPNITSIPEDKYALVMELCEKDPADLPSSDDGEDWD